MEYTFDNQFRRYIMQFMRLFGGFVVKTGKGRDGSVQTRPILIKYGDISRMVAHIIKQQSENMVVSTPVMSCFIAGLTTSPERRQYATHIDRSLVDERKFNYETKEYENTIGDRFTVERLMPVPYDLTMQLDIYTSNTNEKLQVMEQILVLFNPSVDLQTSSSPLDWTYITNVEMTDDITWDSRQIPTGDTEAISVASLKFKIPIWINPPANVTRRKAVETIITNVRAVDDLPDYDISEEVTAEDLTTSMIITPHDYRIAISNDGIMLMENHDDVYYDWAELEETYSDIIRSDSTITVKHRFGDSTGITGLIEKTDNPKILKWTVDPADWYPNTLPDIDMIVDPTQNYPGDGILPVPSEGQRYLITSEIPLDTEAWNLNIDTTENDIIEFMNGEWIVSFSSSSEVAELVSSSLTNTQYRWSPEINQWQPTINKVYYPGTWDIKFGVE